ncbi:hypothetical protein B0H63DRAFT_238987 [Podospora didyma]|uniref:Zn(2)-C6 fungal-type domain-containing protein n=1 Tax=Podospora didyma TaxID=330526 RepID=A0AAE0NC10_9PEZI|nr:hypothetical protein B0H63DRAFT_238987 [Podospora didyma]
MAEPLKRTFHGCLTCRKRKVRCHGGNPCQNCSRMNITCHSSFDTNLRIRVSTPNGQRVVSSKPDAKPNRGPAPVPQPPTSLAPSALMTTFDSRAESFGVSFHNQFAGYSLPSHHHQPAFVSEAPSIHQLSPSTCGSGIPELDSLQFTNGMWGFDFPMHTTAGLEHDFHNRIDMNTHAGVLPPVSFDALMPGTPVSQQSNPISDSDEGSVSSRGRNRDGTKEWIPRRRKRPKKSISKEETTTAAQRWPSGAESFNPAVSYTQEDFTTEHDEKWTLNRFVFDYGQKCPSICPMRLAVLAWAAKSAAPDGSQLDPSVVGCYSQSSQQVEKLIAIADPTIIINRLPPVMSAAEIIICSTLFLNRYDVLDRNLDAIENRFERITRWLANHPGDLKLSAFACKLLLWNCYLQIRIQMFSSTSPPYTVLLDILRDRGDYHLILEKSHSYHVDMFGHDYPQEQLSEDAESIPASLRLHETFCLLADIIRYRSLQQSQNPAQDLAYAAIDSGIQRAEGEFELAVAMNASANVLRRVPMPSLYFPASAGRANNVSPTDPVEMGSMLPSPSRTPPLLSSDATLSRHDLHWLMTYAVFLTAKILWSRTVRPDIRTDDSSNEAVESILQIALLLRKSQGRHSQSRGLLSTLWPLPLFVASVETVDEVRADWAHHMFIYGVMEGKKGGASSNEGNGRKALHMMEEVRRRQDAIAGRVGMDAVIADVAGPQGIFVFLR